MSHEGERVPVGKRAAGSQSPERIQAGRTTKALPAGETEDLPLRPYGAAAEVESPEAVMLKVPAAVSGV